MIFRLQFSSGSSSEVEVLGFDSTSAQLVASGKALAEFGVNLRAISRDCAEIEFSRTLLNMVFPIVIRNPSGVVEVSVEASHTARMDLDSKKNGSEWFLVGILRSEFQFVHSFSSGDIASGLRGMLVSDTEKLRDEIRELKLKVTKQEILIDKLRRDRKEGIVSDLVGPDTELVVQAVTDSEEKDVDVLLDSQENLISSIKQQIVRISNQIKTGQRMRAT